MWKNGLKIILTLSILLAFLQFMFFSGVIWNIIAPFIFVLSFLILIFKRSILVDKYMRYCLLTVSLLFVVELGLIAFSGLNTSKPKNGTALNAMTYNLFFKNRSSQQSIKLILDNDPDVLFVQELTPKWSDILTRELGKKYPYSLVHAVRGTHGIGIYSKHKIKNQKLLNNASNKPYAQFATLEVNGKQIQLINTHLASPAIAVENKDRFIELYLKNYKHRQKQLSQITKQALSESEKYHCQLLVGDLNTLKYEPVFKKLKLSWENGASEFNVISNFNFPNSGRIFPFLTLDYIMGRGNMHFISSEVIKGGSSDHLAIFSQIEI